MVSTPRSWHRFAGGTAAAALVLTGAAALSGSAAPDESGSHGRWPWPWPGSNRQTPVQILSFNDFHGNLEPPAGSSGRVVVGHSQDATGKVTDVTVDAGGVANLASKLRTLRRGQRNTITVAAGDIVGASPLLSAAFHDEPTILAMNKLGLDVTSVGNHEFDEGYREVQRLARGGCLPDGDGRDNQNSCPDGKRFRGATFPILAANVIEDRTGRPILPSVWVKRLAGGGRIGFIGMTLKGTPDIVTKSGVAGLTFTDEVRTANRLVPILRRHGVNAIVVLIHQGGVPKSQTYAGQQVNPTYDYTCAGGGSLTDDSAILPIARRLSPAIDLIVSGHTHQPYVCNVPDPAGRQRLVTSAYSYGRLVTETTLMYDHRTNDIVRASVRGANMIVDRGTPAADLSALVGRYKDLVAPIESRVIGSVTTDVTREQDAAGESQLGDLIADAQLADDSTVTGDQAPQIAFMNPGGIRTDLAAGEVTFGEAFAVQPFNNYLVSMTMTGAQIHALLNQQWSGPNAGTGRKILQVSDGFSYAWDPATATLDASSVTLDGQPVPDDASATYRVVANSFLADGGDGFAAFAEASDKYVGGLDIDGFADYLGAHSPYTPPALDRIRTS